MSTLFTRSSRRSRPRTSVGSPTLPRRATPITLTGASAADSTVTYTFDQPVVLDGLPRFTVNVVGAQPTSAVRVAPNTVAVTYSTSMAALSTVTVGFEDPAIRNTSGGFINARTLTLP